METTRSADHRWMERVLSENGISFISESTEFPPYELDLYLPEWHLCVEVDGPFHGPKRDRKRDEYLSERYALPTLRIKTTVWRWKDEALSSVIKFIEEHAESTYERKTKWRDPRPRR